ncbi:hypothetical protein [Halorubrum aethiopicum]|uniref:hypothetical protein n=1 Tax=Halorubrum aethiopicum TaxID=1758255 RepID=UPI000A3DF649|nr:hypothetical protein [Halorubrum aethiopicum]
MSSDKIEIYRSAYDEYSTTHSQLHDIQQNLNTKAIEIAKINLLVGSIIATVVTIQPENISLLYFFVGSATLLGSIWYSAVVYSQTKSYDIGLASSAFDQMASTDDLEEHYLKLSQEYSQMVSDFDDPYDEEKQDFERSLWLAIATIFLFVFGAISTIIRIAFEFQYPLSFDYPVILIIGVLLVYGMDRDALLNPQKATG